MTKNRKLIVVMIEYTVPLEDCEYLTECLEKMRESGSAEIVDAKIIPGRERD